MSPEMLPPDEPLSHARRILEEELAEGGFDQEGAGPVPRVVYEEALAAYDDLLQDHRTLIAEADDLRSAKTYAQQRVLDLEAEVKAATPLDVPAEIQSLRDEIRRLEAVIQAQRHIIARG